MTQKLMSKDEVLGLDLWTIYWNYLLSLQEAFKKELQAKLGDIEIETWIMSYANFLDTATGKILGDAPELEEIHFRLGNHVPSVRIGVSYAHTSMIDLEFVENTTEGEDDHYYVNDKHHSANRVFSDEMISTASEWLKDATISSSVMDKLKHYPS